MKSVIAYIIPFFLLLISCRNSIRENSSSGKPVAKEKATQSKPPSNYQDTLFIDYAAAVFYHPDSLQLEKVKEMTDSGVFGATTHEYFYQMRNARISIKRDWPDVKIAEAQQVRYLCFGKSDTVIDLDTRNDLYGLFLYRPGEKPLPADMMNIDTELGFYFKK